VSSGKTGCEPGRQNHDPFDEALGAPTREQQIPELVVGHRLRLDCRGIKAMPGATRLNRDAEGRFSKNQLSVVWLGVVELDPYTLLSHELRFARDSRSCRYVRTVAGHSDDELHLSHVGDRDVLGQKIQLIDHAPAGGGEVARGEIEASAPARRGPHRLPVIGTSTRGPVLAADRREGRGRSQQSSWAVRGWTTLEAAQLTYPPQLASSPRDTLSRAKSCPLRTPPTPPSIQPRINRGDRA